MGQQATHENQTLETNPASSLRAHSIGMYQRAWLRHQEEQRAAAVIVEEWVVPEQPKHSQLDLPTPPYPVSNSPNRENGDRFWSIAAMRPAVWAMGAVLVMLGIAGAWAASGRTDNTLTPVSAATVVPVPARVEREAPAVSVALAPPSIAPAKPVSSPTPAVAVAPKAAAPRAVAPAPRQARGDGDIVVTSQPSGARVSINGVGWGQTPLTVRFQAFGAKTIRITRDGYQAHQQTLRLTADQATARVHAPLRPLRRAD